MAYDTILEKINTGEYDHTLPFPHYHTIASKEEKALMRRAYQDEGYRLNMQFKQDLFDAYEIADHPKREKLWSLAWDMGHSSGYTEVLTYFDELVELIK